MDGFKSLPKMQCFREGGSVKSKPVAKCYGGKMKEGGKADLAQDKAVVKKAFAMHDKQEHEGEKTDLSKLKKGGRSKKAVGSVKKFKTGGSVNNVYEAKKSSGDKDNIRKTKLIKPEKAAAPSKAATKPNFAGSDVAKEKGKPSGHEDPYIKSKQSGKKAAAPSGAGGPDAFKKGGKVKKCADGGSLKPTDAEENPGLAKLPTNVRNKMGFAKKGGKVAKCAVGGQPGATEAQQKFYNKNKADAKVKEDKAMYEAVGSRGDAARKGMSEGRMDQMGNAYKKGGKAKVKKYAEGGAVMSDEEKNWLGGADATDPFILARMRSALGPKKPQGSYMPNANPAMDNRDVGMDQPPVRSTDIARLNEMAQGQGVFPEGSEALPTSIAAPRPVRRPAPVAKQNYIPNANPAMDNRDVGMPNKPAPYIDIPANNPGMKQFRTDAVSPMETMFNSLFKSRSQRNRKPIS
jgi:hypothetical protein